MVRGDKTLVFDRCKKLTKKFGFFENFEIISLFTNKRGTDGNFLFLKNRFDIF